MYKVYRCVDGMPQATLATYNTLREAYDYAQGVAMRERKPPEAFRILGPLPPDLATDWRSQRYPPDAAPRQYWFVLNGVTPTGGALLASAVLQRASDLVAANEAPEAAEKAREQPAALPRSIPIDALGLSEAQSQASHRKTYSIVREVNGRRQTLIEGFATQDDARAYIKRWRATESDPDALWIIVVPSGRFQRSSSENPPVGVRSRYLRGAPRLRGEVAGSKGKRKWRNREDRKMDASLVVRTDEELGLGIPAQWGKGRRSRKGDYIP